MMLQQRSQKRSQFPRIKFMKKTKTKKAAAKTKSRKPTTNTTIAFLLDRSGSMLNTKEETISGFNEYIKTLQKNKDSAKSRFTMVQFDSEGIDTLYDSAPIKDVKPLNEETFVPRSWTPLYDAVGKTINRMIRGAKKGDNVLFAILTDGQENASSEFDLVSAKRLMKECEDSRGWTFAFLGVGRDGWAAAHHLSIGTQSVSNVFNIDPKDTKKSYGKMARSAVRYCAMASSAGASGQSVGTVSNFWKGDKDDNG